jgi:hypothetical protein
MPNYPTTQISTNNFDSSADSPSSARADLLQLVQNINAFVSCINTAGGLAKLDNIGRASSANLTIPSSALSGEVIATSNIAPSAIQGNNIEDSTLTLSKMSSSSVSSSTTLSTSDTVLPTCGAVKSYLESNLSLRLQGYYDVSSLSASGTNTTQGIGTMTKGNTSYFTTTTVSNVVRAKVVQDGTYLISLTSTLPSGVTLFLYKNTNSVSHINYSGSGNRGQGSVTHVDANDYFYFKTTGTGTITNIQLRLTKIDI